MVKENMKQPIHEILREAATSRAKRKELVSEALDQRRAQELVDDLYAVSDTRFATVLLTNYF